MLWGHLDPSCRTKVLIPPAAQSVGRWWLSPESLSRNWPSPKTAILLKVMPPPCFLGAACNPPWIWPYEWSNQTRDPVGLARTLLKLQTSSATLSAKSHFLQSLSLSFPLIVDAKSTLNKFTLCQSPFQSVCSSSIQSELGLGSPSLVNTRAVHLFSKQLFCTFDNSSPRSLLGWGRIPSRP